MSVSVTLVPNFELSMEVCRACLVSNELMPFDEYFLINYNLLTNLNVSLDDSLPKYFCQSCVNAVNFFAQFKQKCTENENTLRAAIENTKLDVDSTQPIGEQHDSKEEIKVKTEDIDYFGAEQDDQSFPAYFEDGDYSVKVEEQEDFSTTIYSARTRGRAINEDSKIQTTDPVKSPKFKKYNQKVTKKKKRNVKRECSKVKSIAKDKSQRAIDRRKFKSCFNEKVVIDESSKTPENTSLDCGICIKKGFDENMLKIHLEGHTASKQCELCGEKIWTWPHLLGHRLQHLPKPQQKCHLCNRSYKSSTYLEYHYLNLHLDGYEKLIRCNQCWRSYANPRKLVQHRISVHAALKYVCDYCSKGFVQKNILVKHMAIHSEEKRVICEFCPFACKSSTGLKNHIIHKHTPTKVKCKECSRVFLNQEKKDKHVCKTKRVCPICGIFLNFNSAKSHMRSHYAVDKYKCDRCPAAYKTPGGLRTHKNRHDGIRNYKCEYCPAKFFYASVLIKHRRTHTGEKPYVCEICTKSFTGSNNLKVHMKIHGQFLINKKIKEDDES